MRIVWGDEKIAGRPKRELTDGKKICGHIEIHMNAENGRIQRLDFYGDYFSSKDNTWLSQMLVVTSLEEDALGKKLEGAEISQYFHNLTMDLFCSICSRSNRLNGG